MPQLACTHGVAPAGAVRDLIVAHDAVIDAAADRLHDGPVQALVVARYAADLAVRGGDPVLARDAVQDALVQLRAALWHLRPRRSSEGDFSAALVLLSQRLVDEGRAGLDLQVDAAVAAALSPSFTSVAYRLVQAVAVPADAGLVRVNLGRLDDRFTLELVGGVAPTDLPAWVGGARALGGTLTAESAPTPRLVFAVPDCTVGDQL
ncbi:MAG: hypothetical protein ABIO67_05465 [Mycobacteriales bacterium]